MIEKMRIKIKQTKRTLNIPGIDAIKDITTSFIPSFFDITLNGLSALKALNAFKDWKADMSKEPSVKLKSIREVITTKKSN